MKIFIATVGIQLMSDFLKWFVTNNNLGPNEISLICYFEILGYSAFIVMLINASTQLYQDLISSNDD